MNDWFNLQATKWNRWQWSQRKHVQMPVHGLLYSNNRPVYSFMTKYFKFRTFEDDVNSMSISNANTWKKHENKELFWHTEPWTEYGCEAIRYWLEFKLIFFLRLVMVMLVWGEQLMCGRCYFRWQKWRKSGICKTDWWCKIEWQWEMSHRYGWVKSPDWMKNVSFILEAMVGIFLQGGSCFITGCRY